MTTGIVLAGGASSRMGQPKALLPLGGLALAERLVRLFGEFCERTILVTGAHHREISTALAHLPTRIVFNENHADGMFSSLRKGLVEAGDSDLVLFSPVDYAAVHRASIAQLFAATATAVVKPRWKGHSGHPVLLRRSAIDALLAAPPTANAKQVLQELPATYVDVEDESVARDCDTPEDYAAMVANWGQSS